MKLLATLSVGLSMLASTASVQAQCSTCPHMGACHPLTSTFCDNVNWPRFYVPPARCAVNSTYAVMIANGWRRQNLLGDYHFEEGTNELTKAGKLKAKWVLTQAPQEQRTIYVQRGDNESTTASRIAAVHSWAANQSSVAEPVSVNDTHIVSEGHPAGAVDHVFVGFQANQPPPILPSPNGSGNSASAQP